MTTQENATPATETVIGNEAPATGGRKKKWLSAVFNMAAGAATSIAVKTTMTMALGATLGPIATIVASAVAVALATTVVSRQIEKYRAKKKGVEAKPFNFGKAFSTRLLFAGIGSVIGTFAADWVKDLDWKWPAWLGGGSSAPDAAPVAPPVEPQPEIIVPPAAPACPSAVDAFKAAVEGDNVSKAVTNAMERAASDNAAVAAQGMKDLGYYSLNGLGGVEKNASLAAELFAKAAEAGNMQAQTDLAYMQYHGLGGIVENKAAAIEAVKSISGERALTLGETWSGKDWTGYDANAKFDVKAITQGMTPRCP